MKAIHELERVQTLNEDVLRFLTTKTEDLSQETSPVMKASVKKEGSYSSNRECLIMSNHAIPNITQIPTKRPFLRRKKTCPFSGDKSPKIDYKDTKLLRKYLSERGKMIPSRITAVSAKKQRELAKAIKRSRFIALIPYQMD